MSDKLIDRVRRFRVQNKFKKHEKRDKKYVDLYDKHEQIKKDTVDKMDSGEITEESQLKGINRKLKRLRDRMGRIESRDLKSAQKTEEIISKATTTKKDMGKIKKYFGGGKLASKAAEKLESRAASQAKKAGKSATKAAQLLAKSKKEASGKGAGLQNFRNFINAERAEKRAARGNAQQARSERSSKAANFARKRSEISAANKNNRAAKAEIRKRYR